MANTKRLSLTARRKAWAEKRQIAPTFKGSPLVHNAAVGARYQKRLERLVSRMTEQTRKEVMKLFDSSEASSYFAMDASIGSQARILMNALNKRFSELFAKEAKPAAESMVNDAAKAGKTSLHASLQKLSGGMSLKTSIFDQTSKEILKATIAENVGLIKSIAAEYMQKVEGAVMRSITTGNGLQDLVPAIEKYQGQTHRRAKNIALDQTRKAYNSINKARMQALGVKKFMWHHSGGGANPREEHIKMDGQIYSFDNLPVIDERTGETGIPGQCPNCKCIMSPVFEFEE